MAYERKTVDVFVLYGDYGDGYEEILCEHSKKEAMDRLREYKENCPQYKYRVEKHRERKEK